MRSEACATRPDLCGTLDQTCDSSLPGQHRFNGPMFPAPLLGFYLALVFAVLSSYSSLWEWWCLYRGIVYCKHVAFSFNKTSQLWVCDTLDFFEECYNKDYGLFGVTMDIFCIMSWPLADGVRSWISWFKCKTFPTGSFPFSMLGPVMWCLFCVKTFRKWV